MNRSANLNQQPNFRQSVLIGTTVCHIAVALFILFLWIAPQVQPPSGTAGGNWQNGTAQTGTAKGTGTHGDELAESGNHTTRAGRSTDHSNAATGSAEGADDASSGTSSRAERTNDSSPSDVEAVASNAASPTRTRVTAEPQPFTLAPIAPPTAASVTEPPGDGPDGAGAADAGGTESTKFFGIKANGRRFVFIVDRSGSMSAGGPSGMRFTRACEELLNSVSRLRSSQSFYVYFFTSGVIPMFESAGGRPRLLNASRSNVRRLEAWVNECRPAGGNGGEAASIIAALKLRPDAIFFLSDGGFDPGTANTVREHNRSPIVPINTIGFQDRSRETLLKQMASDSGGKYRFVP